ncbi:MAG: hypothetical protein ABI237_19040 [Ginsengibacter sp.]
MKKISLSFLIAGMAVIIYLFVKEQFKGAVLSPMENMLLSITYLVVGISIFILYRIRSKENKNKKDSENQ